MLTTTVDAIYEDGTLKLDEPVDLARSTRVRVRIEIPETPEPRPRPASDIEQKRMGMSPQNRALFDRIRALRERMPTADFDIVEALRDVRENG